MKDHDKNNSPGTRRNQWKDQSGSNARLDRAIKQKSIGSGNEAEAKNMKSNIKVH